MAPVLIHGIERPALAGLLAVRGLVPVADGSGAAVALVPCPSLAPALPRVVQAVDAEAAAALLDAGADDVVLAGDPDALVAARLAALARGRVRGLAVGDLRIDPAERRVTRGGRAVALLPREYGLLLLLARAAGRTVPAEVLRHALSGNACAPGTNVVAVHLSRLRAKLGEGAARIVTDKGRGYRLVAGPGGG